MTNDRTTYDQTIYEQFLYTDKKLHILLDDSVIQSLVRMTKVIRYTCIRLRIIANIGMRLSFGMMLKCLANSDSAQHTDKKV